MFIEQFIQKIFPESYPLLSSVQLSSKGEDLKNEGANLKRQFYFKSPLSAEKKELTQQFPKFLSILVNVTPQLTETPKNICNILMSCDLLSPLERVYLWVRHLNSFLTEESRPEFVLFHLGMPTPLHYAGVLLYLLENNLEPAKIISLGFLHQFFGLFGQDAAQEIYALLRQISDFTRQRALEELLQKAHEIACESTSMPQRLRDTALDGSFQKQPARKRRRDSSPTHLPFQLPRIKITPMPLKMDLNEANLKNLHLLFEHDFFMEVLYLLPTLNVSSVKNFLSSFFKDISQENLFNFYLSIHREQPQEKRVILFKSLDVLLTQEQLKSALLQKDIAWMILAANMERVALLSEETTAQLINEALTLHNIQYFALVYKYPFFSPLLPTFLRRIFEFVIAHPECSIPSLMIDLKKQEEVAEWCHASIIPLKNALIYDIEQNQPFTYDAYRQIESTYLANKAQADILFKLSDHLDYPHGTYDFNSFIIETLYELNGAIDLVHVLQIIYQNTNEQYEEGLLEQAYRRSLYECLCRTRISGLHDLIIEVLTDHFKISNWRDEKVGTSPLLHRAFFEGNELLLSDYFSPDLSQLLYKQKLQKVNREFCIAYGENLWCYLLRNHEKALACAVSLYPKGSLLDSMNFPDNTLHYLILQKPKAFELLLNALTPPELNLLLHANPPYMHALFRWSTLNISAVNVLVNFLWKNNHLDELYKKDNQGNTLFHRVLTHMEMIPFIYFLKHIPEEQQIWVLNEKNHDGETLLYLIAQDPAAFALLFNSIPEKMRVSLLKIPNNRGNTVFHRVILNPNSTRVLTQNLSAEDVFIGFSLQNNTGNTAFHLAAHHAQSLKVILERIIPDKRTLLAAIANHKGNLVFHLTAHKKSSLHILLDLIPPSALTSLLEVPNQKGHSAFQLAQTCPETFELMQRALQNTRQSRLRLMGSDPLLGIFSQDEDEMSLPAIALNSPPRSPR